MSCPPANTATIDDTASLNTDAQESFYLCNHYYFTYYEGFPPYSPLSPRHTVNIIFKSPLNVLHDLSHVNLRDGFMYVSSLLLRYVDFPNVPLAGLGCDLQGLWATAPSVRGPSYGVSLLQRVCRTHFALPAR